METAVREASATPARPERLPVVGDVVIACDEHGVDHNALVTINHGSTCLNVTYVSDDPEKKDGYGRQIDRHLTSLGHSSDGGTAHGRYWRWPHEARRLYVEPSSV